MNICIKAAIFKWNHKPQKGYGPVTVRPKKPMAMKTKVIKTERKMMPKCASSRLF